MRVPAFAHDNIRRCPILFHCVSSTPMLHLYRNTRTKDVMACEGGWQ